MTRATLWASPLLIWGLAAPANGETVTLFPRADGTLFANTTGALSSGSGPALFVGNNSQSNTRRALVAFDVAASIPEGSTISRVELRLFLSHAPDTLSSRTIMLHRVLADWGEGASSSNGGAGAPSTPGDATWIHRFYPDSLWANPGGDSDPAASAMQVVRRPGFYSWSGPGMVADVQRWLDQPSLAFGWVLQGEEGQASTARRFDSRENPAPENRPVLVVDFTRTTAVVPVTWGQVKSFFANSR